MLKPSVAVGAEIGVLCRAVLCYAVLCCAACVCVSCPPGPASPSGGSARVRVPLVSISPDTTYEEVEDALQDQPAWQVGHWAHAVMNRYERTQAYTHATVTISVRVSAVSVCVEVLQCWVWGVVVGWFRGWPPREHLNVVCCQATSPSTAGSLHKTPLHQPGPMKRTCTTRAHEQWSCNGATRRVVRSTHAQPTRRATILPPPTATCTMWPVARRFSGFSWLVTEVVEPCRLATRLAVEKPSNKALEAVPHRQNMSFTLIMCCFV